MARCVACSEPIESGAAVCKRCGAAQPAGAREAPAKGVGDPTLEGLRQIAVAEEEARTALRIRLLTASLAFAIGVLAVAAGWFGIRWPEKTHDGAASPSAGPTPSLRATAAQTNPADDLKADEAARAHLTASSTFAQAWQPGHEVELALFLTGISELLASSDTERDMFVAKDLSAALRQRDLADVAVDVAAFTLRNGRVPPEFEAKAGKYLQQISGLPHRGLWSPKGQTGAVPWHDFTALAVAMSPNSPELLRELIEARSFGPFPWPTPRNGQTFLMPALATERGTLERLATLATLSPEESRRLKDLVEHHPRVGDEFAIGELAYSVQRVSFPRGVGDENAPLLRCDGSGFIVVSYVVKNLGRQVAVVRSDEMRLVDRAGREIATSPEGMAAYGETASADAFWARLLPDARHEMVAVFEAPEDVRLRGFKILVPEQTPPPARCGEGAVAAPRTRPADTRLAQVIVEHDR